MIRPTLDTLTRAVHRAAIAAGAVALGLAFLAPVEALAARGSGIAEAKDGDYIMVSKDVGGQRWAMTYDYFNGVVLGNVYSNDGGAPQFVACDVTAEDENGDLTLACEGNDACTTSPCPDWVSLGTVNLPGSFFALP